MITTESSPPFRKSQFEFDLKQFRGADSLSDQKVFEFQQKHLLAVGFSQTNEFGEVYCDSFTVAGERYLNGIVLIISIKQVFFKVLSHHKTSCMKKFTHILPDLFIS